MRFLRSPQQRAEKDILNQNHQSVAAKLQSTLYSYSGRILDHKTAGMIIDGSKATPEQISIYNAACDANQSKELTSHLLTHPVKGVDKVRTDIEKKQTIYEALKKVNVSKLSPEKAKTHKKELLSAETNLKYSESMLMFYHSAGVGVIATGSPDTQEHLRNNYQYDVMKGVKGRLDSWLECDESARNTYTQAHDKYVALSGELAKEYGPEVIAELNDLIQTINGLGQRYTDISYLNYKFLSFFRECWRPNVLANETGLTEGHWIAKDHGKDKRVVIHFDAKVNAELLKRKSLWANEKCIFIDTNFLSYVKLHDQVKRYRKQASLTLVSEESPIPIGFSLDGNAAKMIRLDNDKNNQTLTITIELPNGDERSYIASYQSKKNNKCYYQDLEIRLPRS